MGFFQQMVLQQVGILKQTMNVSPYLTSAVEVNSNRPKT